jgi:L-ribulokinase
MSGKRYALGVDYGTNSVRALIVDIDTGEEVGSSIYPYTSGRDGIILDADAPHFARQNPEDYVQGMESSVRGAVEEAMGTPGFAPERILGIGVDTTGSTPIPVDESGMPLSFLPKFSDNPNAMAWLWKDHTSYREAELISSRAREYKVDYTRYCGGMYSSEWFFAKILHLANTDPEVFHSAATFVEHCDWMPALLWGIQDRRL